MKHLVFACAALFMSAAAPQLALADDPQDGESRAVLATPATKPIERVIDGRIWRCDGAVCGAQPTAQADAQRIASECRHAAVHLGAFLAYQTGSKSLTSAQLTDCNASLK